MNINNIGHKNKTEQVLVLVSLHLPMQPLVDISGLTPCSAQSLNE